jgi:hypothetical protein
MQMTTKLIASTGLAAMLLAGAGLAAGLSAPGAIASGTTTTATSSSVEDISGPCDEAEHRNDPRCTGVAVAAPPRAKAGDDNQTAKSRKHRRGKGKGRSGHGGSDRSGHDGSDRSGSNSGRG